MSTIKIPTPFNIDLEFAAADSGIRLLAYILDFIIRIIAVFGLVFLVARLNLPEQVDTIVNVLFIFIPFTLYYLLSEIFMDGQTLGKKIVKIKVRNLSGNAPSLDQYIIRNLFRLIESPAMIFAVLAYLTQVDRISSFGFMLFVLCPAVIPLVFLIKTKYNQRLGDVVANTIVISSKKSQPLTNTIFREITDANYQVQFPQIMRINDKDLNKIKDLLDRATQNIDVTLADRVAERIQQVLGIQTQMNSLEFLETILNDYNYLATREPK